MLKHFHSAITLFCTLVLISAETCFAAQSTPSMINMLCSQCHAEKPGLMMGIAGNIDLDSRHIEVDFFNHKQTVRVEDKTAFKNVQSLQELSTKPDSGIAIDYNPDEEPPVATRIVRFDPAQHAETAPGYAVDQLDFDQFNTKRKETDCIVYDLRPPINYFAGHIPGAKLFSARNLKAFLRTLPKNKTTPIILYGDTASFGEYVAMNFKELGYSDVSLFSGGIIGWQQKEPAEVSANWLKMAITRNEPYSIIDLRDYATIAKGHIPGAVGIPFGTLGFAREKLPSDKSQTLILYGANLEKSIKLFRSWGYHSLAVLDIDYEVWEKRRYPVAKGAAPLQFRPRSQTGQQQSAPDKSPHPQQWSTPPPSSVNRFQPLMPPGSAGRP